MNTEKNIKIGQTRNKTRDKRKHQVCKVFKIKIQDNSLSHKQKESLKMFFVEAKWIYNDILNFSRENKINDYDYKVNKVTVLNKQGEKEERNINYLHSQIKQTLIQSILSSIKTLSKLRRLKHKVGALKFKSELKSLNLKQPGISYKIVGKNKIKIGGISKPIRVNGLDQFDLSLVELANAKLLNTPNGYYIAITTYRDNNANKTKAKNKLEKTRNRFRMFNILYPF